MNLKPINELYADPLTRIDDRMVAKPKSRFDVFELGADFVHYEAKNTVISPKDYDKEATTIVMEHEKLRILTTDLPKETVVLAKDAGDIQFDTPALVKLSVNGDEYSLLAFSNGAPLYWQNKRCTKLKARLEVGDKLYVDGLLLERREQQLKLTPLRFDIWLNIEKLLPSKLSPEYPLDFPNFRRSPRIYLRQPEVKLKLENVPTPQTIQRGAVMQMIVPPLGMVIASGLISILSSGNGLIMLGMGSASVLTAGFSVSNYLTNRKDVRQKNKLAKQAYEKYLLNVTGKLAVLKQQQQKVLRYDQPTLEELAQMVYHYDPRVYERMLNNDDFLTLSLGQATLPSSYQIDYANNESKVKSKLEQFIEAKIIKPYEKVEAVPLRVALRENTLGLAGNKVALRQALQTMLFQLAAFHSYHDVQFILLVNDTEYQQAWHEWRWLPHFQIESLNLRGIVHNAQTRDMVLNSLYQVLSKRRQEVREKSHGREKLIFKPHLVLVIQDESWLNGHSLNEFLMEDMTPYGVTVIWAKETRNMLPETVTMLVDYHSSKLGTLVNEKQTYLELEFEPASYPKKISLEAAIKRLANLHHVEVEKNSLPESISFLQLYQVKQVADLKIKERWQKADTSRTLAVPLGLRGKDDVVQLNLHEKAHGPHGLLAGTTGSGKSEVLQSFILSLAVNFAPEDVGFLPIDYKGGGMANLFAKLPHLLGSITNLDGASTARALKSIHAELEKRQRLFREFGVNHINGYTKLYKQGKQNNADATQTYPTEPLPHLFLISDEFAELKANEPDFMDELISTARIGRSLGVHLILATQKPSGVVNEQIWSNSRFKIALKVAEPADSKEIIRTPDAASITLPGRAYLQVGNNEIYELFQTAYSGAKYEPTEAKATAKVDDRIWLINHLGQAELLTTDLSAAEIVQAEYEENQTELEVVVDEIAQTTKENGLSLPTKPWLPDLLPQIVAPEVAWENEWQKPRRMVVPFGMLDIPEKQAQKELLFDLEKFTPAVLLGSSGYGKSTALQTLVLNLARYNSPTQVQFNLLDFGNNGLLPLRKLPHVADHVRLDEREKFFKMLQRILETLEKRKALFQEHGVVNLEQYEAMTKQTLAVIVNVIDAYDTIIEDDERETVDSTINRILREGAALGVLLVMSSNQMSAYRLGMRSNIAKTLLLYLVNNDDLIEVLGRKRLQIPPLPGRGQLEIDDTVDAFQTYQPISGDDSLSIVKNIVLLTEKMDAAWTGERPAPIPMLPLQFATDYLESRFEVSELLEQDELALAFDIQTTAIKGFVPSKHHFFTMIYGTEEQRQMLDDNLMFSLRKTKAKTILVDFEEQVYADSYAFFDEVYTAERTDTERLKLLLADYVKLAGSRKSGAHVFMYIPNLRLFFEKSGLTSDNFILTLKQAWRAGLYIIISDSINYLEKGFDLNVQEFRKNITAGVVTARVTDTDTLKAMGSSLEKNLPANEAYFFEAQGTKHTKVRLAGEA